MKCTKCENDRHVHSSGLVSPYCLSCLRQKNNETYERNKVRFRIQRSEYCRANKSSWVARKLSRVYGLTIDEYTAMFIAQGGACYVCKATTEKLLAVDHDHATNRVRKLLCSRCNLVVGQVGEKIEILERLIDYLRENADSIKGVA